MASGWGAGWALVLALALLSVTTCSNHPLPAHRPSPAHAGSGARGGGRTTARSGREAGRAVLRLRGGCAGSVDDAYVDASVQAAQDLMIPQLVNFMGRALEAKGPREAELAAWLDLLLRGKDAYDEDPTHHVWADGGLVPVHVAKRIAELDCGVGEPEHGWAGDSEWREGIVQRGGNMSKEETWRFMFGLIEEVRNSTDAAIAEHTDGRMRFGPPEIEQEIKPLNETGLAEYFDIDDPAYREVLGEIEDERARGEGRFLAEQDREAMEEYIYNKTGWVCPRTGKLPFPPPQPGEHFPEIPKVPPEFLGTMTAALDEVDKLADRGHEWDGVDQDSLTGFDQSFRAQVANWPIKRLFEPLFPDPPEPETVELKHAHDFDENGVFYHLGSRHAPVHPMYDSFEPEQRPPPLEPWINPAKSGRVRVICGARGADGDAIDRAALLARQDVLERETELVGDTFFFRDGWFGVDLGNCSTVRPSAYTLRQGGRGRVMVSWVFEGSNSEVGPWVELDKHWRDAAMLDGVWGEDGKDERFSRTFPCAPGGRALNAQGDVMRGSDDEELGEPAEEYFRYLRVRQMENDADPDDPSHEQGWLWVQGFEVYGTLVVSSPPEPSAAEQAMLRLLD